jgi:hypothetical protein
MKTKQHKQEGLFLKENFFIGIGQPRKENIHLKVLAKGKGGA